MECEPIYWILATKTYKKNVVAKFEELMASGRSKFQFPEYKTPMDKEYHPELDDSEFLDPEYMTRYQSMVGSLNWVITLGRFDIQYAVSTMARYNSAPRPGHFKALIRVFGYLKKFDKGRLLIDPTLPEHEKYPYDDLNSWQDLYSDAVEEIPPDAPIPKD